MSQNNPAITNDPAAGAAQGTDTSAEVAAGVRRGLDAAREHIEEAADTMNEKLNELGAAARRHTARAREVAREQYEARAEQLREGYSKMKDNVGEWSDDVSDYVRENPGRSLLIAAGVGFALGLLVRSIRRD